jgi:gliding motility-associated-like protein
MSITVAAQVTPTFTQIGPLCQNSAAPALPTTSLESITGTWAPATVSTTTPGTTTYTFTPDAGQCGTTATMSITVAAQVTPTFTQIGPLCQNSAAPALPGTSLEAIKGTWAPATISTATLGATTYTFTPAAGQCGTTVTMSIIVATQVTPTFTQIGPFCQNSAATALPGTSIEGITGTWAPAAISTTSLGTTTYTFTPDAGQCGTTATMNITVATQITPTFTQIGPLCQNSTAPALPGTSLEGVSGTWNPASINTTAAGTTTYTFTPSVGQCGSPVTMDIVIGGPTAIAVTPTNAGCGASNGSVTLGTVTGGTGPYLYYFNGGGFSSKITYNNLAAGSYTLGVQDANGCVFNAPNVLISNIGGPTSVAITPADATCPQSNGSITVGAVTGGVGPYTFDLNNTGVFTATTVYNNLAAGQYIVSVKDFNGCIFTAPATTVGTTGGPTVTITNPAPICASGSADITAAAITAGSTPGLTYKYFTDAAGIVPLATPAAISAGGTYYIVGKTAGGCASAVMPVVVTARTGATAIQVAATNAGCGASNGIVLLGNVTGGVAPYQYNFNGLGFSTKNTYSNLAAGSYTLVVQDANGCTFNAPNISISNTGGATALAVAPTDATCGQNNGSITVGAVTGGVGPYTYSINNGAYTSNLVYNNLIAGNYIISVKDVNGCVFNAPAAIINNVNNTVTPTFAAIANVCQNAIAPQLPLTSGNGISGTWNPAAINTALTGPNVYTFTPTGNPCAAVATLTVTVNAAPAGTTNVSVCPNQLPYTWNGQLYTAPGTYTQTFTRAAGCDSMATMTLTVDQSMANERYPTVTTSPNTATQLQARQLGSNFDYVWDPSVGLNSISIYNPIFSYNLETEYTISIVSDQGCKVVDTLLVKVNGAGPAGVASDLFVPNAWTPNGDGVNDKLFPLAENVTKLNYFRVFNRWGQLMFETSTIGDGWDGVFNGKPMMMDTYTWTAEAVGIDGKTFKRSGNAVLIR